MRQVLGVGAVVTLAIVLLGMALSQHSRSTSETSTLVPASTNQNQSLTSGSPRANQGDHSVLLLPSEPQRQPTFQFPDPSGGTTTPFLTPESPASEGGGSSPSATQSLAPSEEGGSATRAGAAVGEGAAGAASTAGAASGGGGGGGPALAPGLGPAPVSPSPQPLPNIQSPSTIMLQDDGTDWGARINAADAKLGTSAGVIEVTGGGNIATQIVISSNHTLRFGPGTWINSVVRKGGGDFAAILLKDNTVLEGHGWDTIIQESSDPAVYGIVLPYGSSLFGGNQVNNISVRNIQFSGVGITKAGNGTAATAVTGLLKGGTWENIFFNKTHSIGLTVGETNQLGNALTSNVTIRGCRFTNVGGGVEGISGGGVSLAVVNGDHILIDNNTFIDALSTTFIDIEPNSGNDPATNITITNNTLLQDHSTGTAVPYLYGIVTHTGGAAFGPITIANNTILGKAIEVPPGSGVWQPNSYLYNGIYINYGSASVMQAGDVAINNNTIKYTYAAPIVLDNSDNNDVENNYIFMANGYGFVVRGKHNMIKGNSVIAAASQWDRVAHFTINEDNSTGVNPDYNSFINNVTTTAIEVIGPHSISQGNIIIPRPHFP